MKIKNTIMALATASITQVSYASVGLGVSLKSNDSTIYLPIQVTESFKIEPALSYDKREYQIDNDEEGFFAVQESYQISVGFFRVTPQKNQVSVYYGGRIGYVKEEFSQGDSFGESKFDPDGYRISPTIGFNYHITESLTVGAEAEWFYLKTDDSNRNNDGDIFDREDKETGTQTRLIIRYQF